MEILCVSNEPIAEDLVHICHELGFIPVVVKDLKELDNFQKRFPLAVVNVNRQSQSPFDSKVLKKLAAGGREGLSAERILALDALDELWGYQIYYSFSCSGYCRIEIDAEGRLKSEDCVRVVKAVHDVLTMPPFINANYYDHVSDALLHSVVESSLAPLVVFLKDRKVWFANLAAQAFFKRPTHLMMGLPVEELIAPGESRRQFWKFIEQVMQKPGLSSEFRMRARNGEEFDALITANQIFDSRLPLESIGFTLYDITERKLLENRLHQSQKMEVVGQLAGGIAHDFNNILTGILGNISLAMMEEDIQKIQPILTRVEQAGERAAGLVKQLLDFSRRSQVDIKAISLPAIINEVVGIIQNLFDRRIRISVEGSEHLPLVLADAGQMNQVVLNLCVNARDALEQAAQQGICSSPRIDIRMENLVICDGKLPQHSPVVPGHYVKLSVSDNGIGMDEATLKRVFEPFFTTKSLGKGSGLGLATIYGIIHQHRGWIDVDSHVGEGTTFTICLPVAPNEPPEPVQSAVKPPIPHGNETVLIIDDEEVIRDLGTDMLSRLGYTVRTANDGQDGLDQFFRDRDCIDLVILDLSMPRLSGREVLAQIRSVEPEKKVIISSGYDVDQKSYNFENLDASGFVAKPYNLAILAQKVRAVLDEN